MWHQPWQLVFFLSLQDKYSGWLKLYLYLWIFNNLHMVQHIQWWRHAGSKTEIYSLLPKMKDGLAPLCQHQPIGVFWEKQLFSCLLEEAVNELAVHWLTFIFFRSHFECVIILNVDIKVTLIPLKESYLTVILSVKCHFVSKMSFCQ